MKRTCSLCGMRKSYADFYIDRRAPSGFHSACKLCHRAAVRSRRARLKAKDPAALRQSEKRRYECFVARIKLADPAGWRARCRASTARWLRSPKGDAYQARRRAARRKRNASRQRR